MSEADLFLVFARKLNELGLTYMVTGSVAGVLYGEPRMTHDVDIVLVLPPGAAIERFARAFPLEEFYCPPDETLTQEALRAQRGHFNLIHHATGFRADIYLANRDPLHRWALGERRSTAVGDDTVWVAPPEYVIVRKLEFFREGGSEKHVRDIEAMLRVSSESIRADVLREWIERRGLITEWRRVEPPEG
jgi:hypothetical protein